MADTSDALPAGSQFGRFTIEGELGAGGMGRVYRAHDPTLNRPVAIKVLRDASPAARNRLLAEARSASGLNHPNICTIYEVGDVGGVPFIAMELVVGQPLSSLLATHGRSTHHARRLGLQVVAALAHAHERGIVHGDLKPQNVLVTPAGTIKLLDFGLARTLDPASLESITQAGTTRVPDEIAGTLPYMSPETLRGAPLRPAADVWALGVLLYEMAAGGRPFSGPTTFDLADGILHSPPAPLPVSTSPALAAVITRCLEKDPTLRYSTARDAMLALEPAVADKGTPRDRVGRQRRIRRAMYAVVTVAAVVVAASWWMASRVAPPTGRESVASLMVLPFENLSPDPREDYFANGMTDALITDLSRLPNVRVISRTSSMRYRSLGKSPQTIRRELGVEAIVDGSVFRASDQVRISVRLVDAATDRNLWGHDYTGGVQDVLSLQADVARAIAGEIGVSFAPADERRLTSVAAVSPAAIEQYLWGRHQWNRRTPSSLRQALAHFRQAVALQPDYAAAHAAIAETLVLLPAFPISAMPPEEALLQARASAERAIALDDRLAEAHAALAYVRLHSLDHAGAEAAFQRALDVNPGYATAHFWYAAALASVGRFDDAIEHATRAERLDPVSPIILSGTAWMHHLARRFDMEVQSARRALDLEPNFLMAHYRLGEGLLHQGQMSQAVDALDKARALSDDSPDLIAAVAYAHGRAGQTRAARAALQTLLRLRTSNVRYVSPYAVALVYTGLADRDQAFAWLRRAHTERAWGMAFLNVEPAFDSLRSDPRFAALVSK